MRMRLKSNLDSRLIKANRYLIPVDMSERNAKLAIEKKDYIDLANVFGNDNPIYLDLGCGKGQFSIEFAKRNPNINIIGVELVSNVLLDALESVMNEDIPNLRFLNTGVDYLPKYFKEHSIGRIFLNFSTPKQKKTYANSRLTCPRFLAMYELLLGENAEIHQKTDNDDFFEYSVEQFELYGYKLSNVTRDMYTTDDLTDNIVTEYEQMFVDKGDTINRLVAKL